MIRSAYFLYLLFITTLGYSQKQVQPSVLQLIEADHPDIQYTGRIDFTNPKRPKFWASGVYIKAKFRGTMCDVYINDEVPGGTNHNYLTIAVDNRAPIRLKTRYKTDTIRVVRGLPAGEHTVTICKDTESGIGYLEFVGLGCQQLVPLPAKPIRKIEFIGNSITCGTGMDVSEVPCGKGQWHDQHNAYMAYGPRIARQLNAQYQLTSVSGIGLIHSCCGLTITMPDVFDKVNQRANAVPWNFSRYTPDVVTICLGQNDGVQDSTTFCRAYVQFVQTIRGRYPNAQIICLTSPMADAKLTAALKTYLTGVVDYMHKQSDKQVQSFFFSRSYNSGCDKHPDLAEHELIASELAPYLKKVMNW